MLYEEVEKPDFVISNLWEFFDHVIRNQITSSALRGQYELFLKPRHLRQPATFWRAARASGGFRDVIRFQQAERGKDGLDEEVLEEPRDES